MNFIWEICLNMVLEAIKAGSLGIGTVIHDENKTIISLGRNQMFDNEKSVNEIKNSTMAHAELNAIIGIPESHKDSPHLTMYSSVEPCPMCIGAVAMSNIRDIVIASPDAWAGGVRLLDDTYLSSKNIRVQWAEPEYRRLFYILNVYSQRRYFKNKTAPVLMALEKQSPKLYARVVELEGNTLPNAITSSDKETLWTLALEK